MAEAFSHNEEGYAEFRAEINAIRNSAPAEFARLIVGPIVPAANGGEWWAFFPDGSKEGWNTSDEGDQWRARFIDALNKLKYGPSGIRVMWGDDEATVLQTVDWLKHPATMDNPLRETIG